MSRCAVVRLFLNNILAKGIQLTCAATRLRVSYFDKPLSQAPDQRQPPISNRERVWTSCQVSKGMTHLQRV